MLLFVKLVGCFLNNLNPHPSPPSFQLELFLSGLSYGMILTLDTGNVEFWYLLVLLTLDIVNTRYQFVLRLINQLFYSQETFYIGQAKISGFTALNSLHLVILAYMVIKLKLNSSHSNADMSIYVSEWYGPILVWVFFSIYEIISLVQLRKRNNLIIIGTKENNCYKSFGRGFALAVGLWLFYLGLTVPQSIFQW